MVRRCSISHKTSGKAAILRFVDPYGISNTSWEDNDDLNGPTDIGPAELSFSCHSGIIRPFALRQTGTRSGLKGTSPTLEVSVSKEVAGLWQSSIKP